MEKAEAKLLTLLHTHGFRHTPDQPYTLSSGRTSPYYIDCKAALCKPEALALAAEVFYERIKSLEAARHVRVDAVGGLTIGADPLAVAVSLHAYARLDPIEWFLVRKEPKRHGLQKWVEGHSSPGSKVVILDDVVTTGNSTLKAIQGARDAGLEIVQLLVLIDRLEGGTESLEATGYPFTSVFTLPDLVRVHNEGVAGARASAG